MLNCELAMLMDGVNNYLCVGNSRVFVLFLPIITLHTDFFDNQENMANYPEDITNEFYSRISNFFGSSHFSDINKSFVVIVGVGGVGSHCAHMLLRSGVINMRLIDFDQVSLSSLNRHAVATLDDVGIPKVTAMKTKFEAIAPWAKVEAVNEMFTYVWFYH